MVYAWEFMQEMFVLYAIALLGFFIRKKGILNENANDVITRLILYITLPSLILFSLNISFSFEIVKEFFWLLFMSVYAMSAAILLAAWMGKKSRLPIGKRSVYEGIIVFGNQGFIGYAVTFILFKEQGIVYLTIFNLFYLFLIWTYGIYLFTKKTDSASWKEIFLNPGVLSTLAGVILFFLPIGWPKAVSNGLEMVGKMTIPLSMLLIGSIIANINVRSFFPAIKNQLLWKAAAVRLIIIPFMLVPFAVLSVPFPLLTIAMVVTGMPSAPTISIYAQKYGGDAVFASLGVLLTTFLCMITIPLLYIIGSIITK